MVLHTSHRHIPADENGDSRECDCWSAKAELVTELERAMSSKGMTQVQAAQLLGTDQPTLSKILRGRTASISLDKLVSWLLTLGRSVEIRVFDSADRTRAQLGVSVPGGNDARG
jgi:predicted XRE-type DNA-binding protein